MDEIQKNYLKELSQTETPLFPFDAIETKINLLIIDINLINRHQEEFPEEIIKILEEKHVPVGSHLLFYVIQEIQDFYRQTFRRFKEAIPFPETAGIVQELRHNTSAHLNAESSSQVADLCILLESKYGFERVYDDYKKFKEKLYSKINSGELKLK